MNSKIRKFRRNVKAISPIISTLLLIAIAVVAALVTYAWVMGYIGFQTGKTGTAIQIQNVDTKSGIVYVENVGTGYVYFSDPCVYVNGVFSASNASATYAVGAGATVALKLNAGGANVFPSGGTYTVKVACTSGQFNQISVST